MTAARWQAVIAVWMIVAAVAGLILTVRRLDVTATDRDVPAGQANWQIGAREPRSSLPLGRYLLPAPGLLHAVICPPSPVDPHGRLRVRADDSGRSVEDVFVADESRGGRCFEASYRTNVAGWVAATLLVRGDRPPVLHEVDVRASRRLTPWAMWPVLLMVLGFGLIVMAPSRAAVAGEAPASSGPATWVGGIMPADLVVPGRVPPGFGDSEPQEPPALEDSLVAAVPSLGGAPVDWRYAWVVALAAYATVHVVMIVMATAYFVVTHTNPSTLTGTFIASSMIAQHGLLVLFAAWFLGAFRAGNTAAALGLLPVRGFEIARSVALAGLLVAVAAITTHFIHDVSATPMGKMIERVPIRFAIGFGALLAPFSEELFFRGVLVRAFGRISTTLGVVASATVFTVAHAIQLEGAWIGLVPIAAVGIVNGVLRARTGGISQPWIVHSVYNAALSAGLYFG